MNIDRRLHDEPDVAFRFGHTASAARQARHVLDPLLADSDEDFVWDVTLVISEMVSNVVAHTEDGGVLNAWATNPFRIEVHDSSHVIPRLGGKTDDMGGRGLGIVDTLATSWGTSETSSGKVVWAEFNRPERGAHAVAVRRGA